MTVQDCEAFLDTLDMPSLMPDERDISEGMININECFDCLQSCLPTKPPEMTALLVNSI